MKIKIIVIDFELSPWLRRAVAGMVGPLVLVLAFGTTVDAAPTTFVAGETLGAAKMNAAFTETDARLARIEARLDPSRKYSNGAVFCGATLGATVGDMSGFGATKGYGGAKTACEITCAGSPTAHLCTSDEVLRSVTLGMAVKSGWYAAASTSANWGNYYFSDCDGFMSTAANVYGPSWDSAASKPNVSQCNVAIAALCCDQP
jgi:hypothetical protein